MKKVVLLLLALTLMVLLASCELVDMFHYCESACPVCGKCRDLKCVASICAEKCEGNHPEHLHSLNFVESMAPTCEDEGYEAYYACECGKMFADEAGENEIEAPTVIDALGHTEKTVDGKDATCTEAGFTEGKICSDCKKVLVAQEEIAVRGHSFTNYISVGDATCEADGTKTAKCDRCDATDTKADENSKKGHDYSSAWVSDENGHWHICANGCGVNGSQAAHTPNIENATEYDAKVCTVCSYVMEQALGHTTHTYNVAQHDESHHWNKCYGCDLIDEKIAHSYSESIVSDATCTESGTKKLTCSCGFTKNETIAAKGHTDETVAGKDATCTETGLTDGKKCSVCGVTTVAQETIPAKGHTNSAVQVENNVAADCTNAGSYDNVIYCSVCSKELKRETVTVNALGHTDEILKGKEATCTDTGLTEGKKCSVCNEIFVAQEVIDAIGHSFDFQPKFNGSFLYRIGNNNAVELSSLFDVYNYDNITVEIQTNSNGASGGYSNKSIQFTGTGIVTVVVTDIACSCIKSVELKLEVVDAINATSATSATDNNVVLLNDAGFTSLEVSGGYTLYGNGFTLTCSSDSVALGMGYAFVTLNNGILDNVQIVCPNFDYAVLYNSNMTEAGNRSETTDKTRYYNVKSGVMVSGNSQILNSRISGGRAAVNVTDGNCVIDNSRIELGAVASLLIGSANSVTLRDVTLIQKPTASNYDSSKVLMGFSVLAMCDSNGAAAPIILEGTLVQNAWVNNDYKKYVPSVGQSIISSVLSKTEYLHDLDGDGKSESLNLGFAFMPESEGGRASTPNITDNRIDKSQIPYSATTISILTSQTVVYSYQNGNGTSASYKNTEEYVPNKYGNIIIVNYSDYKDGIEVGKSLGENGWIYELYVDLDKVPGYKLDFSKLTLVFNGVPVTDYKVNGGNKPSTVAVTAGGVVYTITVTNDGKEYTATFKVTGTETSKESPSKISGPTTAGFGVAKSYNGDWSGAADVLTGIKIKYWSVAENKYVEFDFSNFTVPGSAGKLNGTNSYWEYTHSNNDFTLKVTNTVAIHSGKSVYGMPIRGTDGKLYFTISSTNGYVGTSTTSRDITMQYEFTDNNGGEKLVFTYTFSIGYDKDNQYSYSDLSGSGKLTKLEDSGGTGTCIAEGTLITLANGTKKPVEDLRKSDLVMSFDHLTGEIVYKDVIIVVRTYSDLYYKNTFVFDDGSELVTINEHGIYDLDLNRYVNIDHVNYADYIGHCFVSVDTNGNIGVKKLIDVVTVCESGYKYDIVTNGTLNYVAEDTLSVTHVLVDVINSFEFGENMMYDQAKMLADIEKYGLYDFDDWNEYCDYSVFEQYNIPVMKVGISKGLYTKEYIIGLINTYVLDDSVQIIDEQSKIQ